MFPSANSSVTLARGQGKLSKRILLRAFPKRLNLNRPIKLANVIPRLVGEDVILVSELIIVKELFGIRNIGPNEIIDLVALVKSEGLHCGGPPAEVNMGVERGEEEQDHRHERGEAAEVTETSNPVWRTAVRTLCRRPRTSNRRTPSSTKYGGLPVLVLVPASSRVGRPASSRVRHRCPHNFCPAAPSHLVARCRGSRRSKEVRVLVTHCCGLKCSPHFSCSSHSAFPQGSSLYGVYPTALLELRFVLRHPSQRVLRETLDAVSALNAHPSQRDDATPWIKRVVGATHHGRYLPLSSAYLARDALKRHTENHPATVRGGWKFNTSEG